MSGLHTPKNFYFIHCNDYIDDLISELNKKPKSIRFVYFKLQTGGLFDKLVPHLEQALKNDTKVELLCDYMYSKEVILFGFYPHYFGNKKQEQSNIQNQNNALMDRLVSLGAKIIYTNKPNSIQKVLSPFVGRDHRKLVYIEHKHGATAYFGATNLDDGNHNDYMIKTSNAKALVALRTMSESFDKNRVKKDILVKINPDTTIINDNGRFFRSTIFKKSKILIKNAENTITFVSQLPPEPPLARLFQKAAKKGVKVTIILPEKSHGSMSYLSTKIAYVVSKIIAHNKNISFTHCKHGFTHAKILIVDKTVVLGSHNLSSIGVYSGTQEISIITADEHLLQSSKDFIQTLL